MFHLLNDHIKRQIISQSIALNQIPRGAWLNKIITCAIDYGICQRACDLSAIICLCARDDDETWCMRANLE